MNTGIKPAPRDTGNITKRINTYNERNMIQVEMQLGKKRGIGDDEWGGGDGKRNSKNPYAKPKENIKRKKEKSEAKQKAENTAAVRGNWPVNTLDKIKLL